MNKTEKGKVVQGVKEKVDRASLAIVAGFKGLKVVELEGLRASLRKDGAEFMVVKNTLARLAVREGTHAVLEEHFNDSCALVFGYENPVGAAKAVVDFAKKNDKFSFQLGSLDGKLLEKSGIESLSKLPSREQLLGMMLGTMNAVPQGFVSLLANVPRSFLNVLNAIKEQKN